MDTPQDGPFTPEILRLERVSRRLSAVRLGSFAALAVTALSGLPSGPYWGALGACAAVFGVAFWTHLGVLDRKDRLERKRLLEEERLARATTRRRRRGAPFPRAEAHPLERGLRIHAPEPETHELDPHVVDDLGVAADAGSQDRPDDPSTLFGFLDWTSTPFGGRRLLHILLHPLRRRDDILRRQEAVREIADRGEVRARILEALLPLRRFRIDGALPLLEEPLEFAGRWGLVVWAELAGTAAPAFIVLAIATGDPRFVGLSVLAFVVNIVTLGMRLKALNVERVRIGLLAPLVDAWLRLGRILGAETRWSGEWDGIRGVLEEARPALEKLRRRIALLELHEFGLLLELLNFLTLWELRILPRASSLIERNRDRLQRAVGALGEAEALACLSLPLAEAPDFEIPEPLARERPFLGADEVGHPLIDPAISVRNPVSLGEEANVLIVTGSNMAGKSTYLKAVGANLVLAGAGGPVCARGFRWTPLAIDSDVNVRDSLDDGKSYFQVEVERVRRAVVEASADPFVLVLFDELFRGTNSTERRAAARAIARFLRSTGALAIIATHDHEITRLVTDDGERGMENRHFRESIEGGEMRFDYRLREGPSVTRNAIRVLEASGYPEEIVREARAEAG